MSRLALLLALLPLLGCGERTRAAPLAAPPSADFVVAAGDSAFWVTSSAGALRVRGAPIELARLNGRFYELYVADDDRSYEDALLVGQRVYRRDLITGDSLLIYEDSLIPRLADRYARLHPGASPLRPDEDGNEEPRWRATSTIELSGVHGPFLSYTYHADVEQDDAPLWHTSRRGVLDVSAGKEASLAQVAGAHAASIAPRLKAALGATLDSVRTAGDPVDRARSAALLRSYRLEPNGFILTIADGQPAVAYALTGQGEGEAGHMLELPALTIGEPTWWREGASSFPIQFARGEREVWRQGSYDVVVRYDTAAGPARLILRDSTSREWSLGAIAAPVSRVYWLDKPAMDSVSRHALVRAFDESVLYNESVRSASWRRGALPRRPHAARRPPRDHKCSRHAPRPHRA